MKRYLETPLSLINLMVDLLEALLGLRFVMRILDANPANVLVAFLYQVTSPLIAPFRGIFHDLSSGGMVIEWSTVLAMLAYGFLAILLVRIVNYLVVDMTGTDEWDEMHTHRHA